MTREASASLASQSEPGQLISICLSAVVVAATSEERRVLALRGKSRDAAEALPSGQLAPEHRTLESGLRAWVERQTKQRLGYVEQLYTSGYRDRSALAHAKAGAGCAINFHQVCSQAEIPAAHGFDSRALYGRVGASLPHR
jgi:hypothetical protein